MHWVDRFMPSKSISDLKQPFQSNVTKFFAALTAGGVKYNINTTLRPPQRSYLMYYAREVASGRLPGWEGTGNAHHLTLAAGTAVIENVWVEGIEPCRVPLPEFRDAVSGWLAFVRGHA